MNLSRKSKDCEVTSSEVVDVKVNKNIIFGIVFFPKIEIIFRKCLMKLKET